MTRFLIDTSCMVALVSAWHVQHQAARREVERRLENGERLIVAGPGVIEAYAVLTRLPHPHRLSPTAARTLLTVNFVAEDVEITALDAHAYIHLLHDISQREIAGGTTYDAVIVACARRAGAGALLTFNARHFERLVAGDIAIVVPQDA
jgi:predicted nucleic acid-binding protein